MDLTAAARITEQARAPVYFLRLHHALGICLAAIGCRTSPIPESQRFPAGTPFRTQYRTIDGTRLRVIDSGRGTPVVLIHGIGASMYSWRYQLPVLASAGYRVIAFDNRGFGFSDKPAHGYSNAAYAHLVTSLLDSLGVSSAVLVGHSMGGAIAAEVALANPDRVRGLVLIGSAGYGIRIPGALKIARWPFLGAVATAFRGRWITGRILRSTFADPAKVTEADIDQYYAPVAAPDFGRTLAGVAHQFDFSALKGRIDSIAKPTLVMWGSRDLWIPPGVGEQMVSSLPRAAFVLVPGAGHDLPDEAPAAVLRSLIPFLQQGIPQPPPNVAILHIDINR